MIKLDVEEAYLIDILSVLEIKYDKFPENPVVVNVPNHSSKSSVTEKLAELGFVYTGTAVGGLHYSASSPTHVYHVLWDSTNNTIRVTTYNASDKKQVGQWTASVGLALSSIELIPDLKKKKSGINKSVALSAHDESKLDAIGFKKYTNPAAMIYYSDTNSVTDGTDVVFWDNGDAWVTIKTKGQNATDKFNTHPSAIQFLLNYTKGKSGFAALKKKFLSGTEDMPWSGTNYPLLWGPYQTGKFCPLNDLEQNTMKHMGWNEHTLINGSIVYLNGNQQMAFEKNGKAFYWSDISGGITQTWSTVEDALRWLWKNKGSAKKSDPFLKGPYYPNEPMVNLLKSIGFKSEIMPDGTKWEHPSGFAVRFYENGISWEGKNGKKEIMVSQTNQYDFLLKALSGTDKNSENDKLDYAFTSTFDMFKPSKPTKQSPSVVAKNEVPYGGTDYKKWYNTYQPHLPKDSTIPLKLPDKKIMDEMKFIEIDYGAEVVPSFRLVYERSDTKEKAYFFASGKGAYWQAMNGPHYFNTVKELMQFLWDKYSPNITDS